MGRSVTLDEQLRSYLLASQPLEHEEQRKLRDFTATMAKARLQIAPEQAYFLAFLLRLTGSREVLELGTFTGYSALTMALALPPSGHVLTCDTNAEWAAIGRPYWDRAGVSHKIELRLSSASETLRELKRAERRFDFMFIDANKDQYDDYYEAALGLVQPAGLIVLDNMLFRGRVVGTNDNDPATIAIRDLNKKIVSDHRIDHVMLAIGDGMTLVRGRE